MHEDMAAGGAFRSEESDDSSEVMSELLDSSGSMPALFGFGRGKNLAKKKSVKSEVEAEVVITDEVDIDDSVPTGSLSTVKNLYKSPNDPDGQWTWTDKYPDDVEEAAENNKTRAYAVIVRNMKSNDSRKKLEAHSIIIQSPWLKEALGHILKDYPGVACELKRLVFDAPFAPFVHRWFDFTTYMNKEDLDTTTKEHLVILQDILKYEIGDAITAFEDYVSNGVVTYEHLWMIFPPGSVVLAAHKGPLSAFELGDTKYKETRCGKFFELKADCVDYSGKSFGRYTEYINIPEFVGIKPIKGLHAFPLPFHPEKEAVSAALIQRGRIFEKLAGYNYKAYDAMAITWDREHNEVPIQVNGRIVLDIASFNRYMPIYRRYTGEWKAKDHDLLKAHTNETNGEETGDFKFTLTPYHHMIARSRTRGYSLKLKKWLDFYVEDVKEVVWNSGAFDKLVLPNDQKELILSFAESQLEGNSFDDVITGKGKGVICLLSGPPGVGKTLTAEAVAESLKVPLHTLSSGDLGSEVYEVEQGLQNLLDLVSRWNAIVLLDECDVFLEARSTHDLERNKVVSIFLRTLEYYQGILFMTTNRVENIDEAFQSRIHVSLEYADLTQEGRRQIWSNFLAPLRSASNLPTSLTDADLDELSELPLNGRQIKNILKTAQLLAARKKSGLKREFINTVLAIEKRRPDINHQK
ncbi:ATPase [Xylariaceae sp. FL0255]|nr:ATPase [Xylariaceae sp. FL0255]